MSDSIPAPPPAADRPIVAAMNQFPGRNAEGVSTQDQSPEQWAAVLTEVGDAGFQQFHPMDPWLRLPDRTSERLQEFSPSPPTWT